MTMNLSCIAKTKYPFCYFSVLSEQKWLYYSPVCIVPICFETNISTQSSISTASTLLSSRIVFLFQEANTHRINCSLFRLGATFSLLGNCWSVKAWTFVVRVASILLGESCSLTPQVFRVLLCVEGKAHNSAHEHTYWALEFTWHSTLGLYAWAICIWIQTQIFLNFNRRSKLVFWTGP